MRTAIICGVMKRLARRPVFAVGRRGYQWVDVLIAARVWSEWSALERRAEEGIACLKDVEDGLAEAETEETADAWRYERDLLSADDMQAWLAQRQLTMEEWLEFIGRSALRAARMKELSRIRKAHRVSPSEVEDVLYAEAVCSGVLERLAERLAGQAAVYDRLGKESKDSRATRCSKAELTAALKGLPRSIRREGFLHLSPQPTIERAEFVACLGICFDRFVESLGSPEPLSREIETHALDWTRLDCETVRFQSEETAREAALLVREDGLTLKQAAATAGARVENRQYVLDDLQRPLKDRLVSALPTDLVGPVQDGSGFILVWVVDRVTPSSRDRVIRRRARDRIISRTIQREIELRVRWHERI